MENLKTCIDMYIAEKKPYYALQISGEWGVGKTYSVNKTLGTNMYYVSVFGLNTIDDVYASLFCSMYSNENKKKVRSFIDKIKNINFSVTGVDIPLGGIANLLAKSIIKDIIRNDKPIVIDDIERSTISLDDIFGLISNCLDRHDCNVILLTTENFTKSQKNSPLIEKTVGRQLTITANFKDAFHNFIDNYISKDILIDLEQEIIDIFKKLNCNSLRILRRLLFEIDMIYKCISNKNTLKNKSTIKKGVIIFSALSISLKKGIIATDSLIERPNYTNCYLSSKNENEKNELLSIYEQLNYEVDLDARILSDEVILDILENGLFNSSKINESIKNYIEFKTGDVEPWIVIYKHDQHEDQIIYKAIDSIDIIFKTKKVFNIGYTLHLISAIYYIEGLFCDRFNIKNTEDYINEYIKYLYENTDCFLQSRPNTYNSIFNDSYGYSYFANENEKFISMKNEIKEKIISYTNNKITKISSEINELIKSGLDLFLEFIESKIKPNTIYTENPILKNINIDTLCLSLINSNYIGHEKIYKFFLFRYSQGQLNNKLEEESAWFKTLIEKLKLINNENSGISKLRVDTLIKKFEYVME